MASALEGCLPNGWVPVDVGSGFSVIRWIYAGGRVPSEPFFERWVANLRADSPRPREFETGRQSLAITTSHLRDAQPAGLILHISRCGSTLVANALSAADDTLVLREHPAFDRMMFLAMSPSNYWAAIGRDTLRQLGRFFASYCCPARPLLVIKTGFAAIAALSAVSAVWPELRFVMIIRDPVEVVVSNMMKQSKVWGDWYSNPESCPLGKPPAEVLERGAQELCAWAVGRMCEEAHRQMGVTCRILEYTDIGPNTVMQVARHFRLHVPEDRLAFYDAFRQDAKCPGKIFEGDSQMKRQAATQAVTGAAERWALAPYHVLLESSLRIRCRG